MFITCIESDSLGNIITNYAPDINNDLVNNDKFYFKYQATPLCLYKNDITLFEALDNYIYTENMNCFQKRYKLNMGKYSMQMQFVYEMNRSHGDEMLQYFRVFGIQETKTFLLLNIMYEDINTFYYAIYNKIDGQVLWKSGGKHEKSFLYNDIDGGPSVLIYPFETDANYFYTLIYPHMTEEYLQAWRDKTVKYPEKRAQLCKLLSEMEEDDNPILVLYKKNSVRALFFNINKLNYFLMVKLQRIKLTRLENSELQEREMKNLVGGQSCGCGCHYMGSLGGSTTQDNLTANQKYGYFSYGGDTGCCTTHPNGGIVCTPSK